MFRIELENISVELVNEFRSMMRFTLSCAAHVVIGMNTEVVGLRLSQLLPSLVDDIIGYVHGAMCPV
jgi:hypothetical protein